MKKILLKKKQHYIDLSQDVYNTKLKEKLRL